LVSAVDNNLYLFRFSAVIEGMNHTITFATPIPLTVSFNLPYGGRYEDRLELVFEDIQLRKRFLISRSLRAIVGSKVDHELLKPKAQYVPRTRLTRQPETNVIEGILPPALNAIPWKVALPHANIPQQVSSILSKGSLADVIKHVRNVLLPKAFNSDNYARHFKNLLWIEEFRMECVYFRDYIIFLVL
jgi:helicase MOV-10